MTKSNYPHRRQASLKSETERLAVAQGTTLDQFVNVAVAENTSVLKTVDYLKMRATCGSAAEALGNLEQAGADCPAQPGDTV